MTTVFYVHATVAIIAMGYAMLTPHAVHALLGAAVSLIALAVSMYTLSAELAAALEVIVYAGAILVLFIFAIMLLKPQALESENLRPKSRSLSLLVALFLGEMLWILKDGSSANNLEPRTITEIATALFHTYGFYVEVISFVLLAGFVTTIFVAKNLSRAKNRDEVRNT